MTRAEAIAFVNDAGRYCAELFDGDTCDIDGPSPFPGEGTIVDGMWKSDIERKPEWPTVLRILGEREARRLWEESVRATIVGASEYQAELCRR